VGDIETERDKRVHAAESQPTDYRLKDCDHFFLSFVESRR
jgi:hypothetical protein